MRRTPIDTVAAAVARMSQLTLLKLTGGRGDDVLMALSARLQQMPQRQAAPQLRKLRIDATAPSRPAVDAFASGVVAAARAAVTTWKRGNGRSIPMCCFCAQACTWVPLAHDMQTQPSGVLRASFGRREDALTGCTDV